MDYSTKTSFPTARRGSYYTNQTVIRACIFDSTKNAYSNSCKRTLGQACRCIDHKKNPNELLYKEVTVRKYPIFCRFW